MRTSLSTKEINARVRGLVKLLSLQECQNTIIGSSFKKGISGGERKRTSIGFELITNPSLLILDEPTSGLDSSTALKVIKLLKREAQRGMTIITSIHQPASDILMKFDRVLLLSEGNQLYNDKPANVKSFFNKLGLDFGRYTNPADQLLKLANNPEKFDPNLTLQTLLAKLTEIEGVNVNPK